MYAKLQEDTREHMRRPSHSSKHAQAGGWCHRTRARLADKKPIAEQAIDRTAQFSQFSSRTFQLLHLGLEVFAAYEFFEKSFCLNEAFMINFSAWAGKNTGKKLRHLRGLTEFREELLRWKSALQTGVALHQLLHLFGVHRHDDHRLVLIQAMSFVSA